jgi:dipeptidyl aminopeptidase/acylaminoacyl peptidase
MMYRAPVALRRSMKLFHAACALCLIAALAPLPCPAAATAFSLTERVSVTPSGEFYMQPVWSPDGKRLAFATAKYGEIWSSDDLGGGLAKVVSGAGAGFRFIWAPDSSSIFCRAKEGFAQRVLQVGLDGAVRASSEPSQELSIPRPLASGAAFSSDGKAAAMPAGAGARELATDECAVFSRDGRIVLSRAGKERILSGGNDTYFLPLLSPDRRWVVCESLGSGLHLMNLESGRHIPLGRGNDAAWAPDSSCLVYDISEDDGERITAADLYIFDLKAEKQIRLTDTPDRIERNPSWSPKGNHIAWDEEGRIYTGTLAGLR